MKRIGKYHTVLLCLLILLLPTISGTQNIVDVVKNNFMVDPESPDPPMITGPSEGELNVVYTFEITTEDPQCDNICYTVMSSDMPAIYKSHFCVSGHVLIYNHSWATYYQTEPPYYIKAMATDCHGHQSEWSYFEVTVPKTKSITTIIFDRLFSRLPFILHLY